MRNIIHVIVPALSLLNIGVDAATIAKGLSNKHSSDDLQVRKIVHARQFHNADFGLDSDHFARNEVSDLTAPHGEVATTLGSADIAENRNFTEAASESNVDTTNSTTINLAPPASTAGDSASNSVTVPGNYPLFDGAMSGASNQDSSDSKAGHISLSKEGSDGAQTSSDSVQIPGPDAAISGGSNQDSSSSLPGQIYSSNEGTTVDSANKNVTISAEDSPLGAVLSRPSDQVSSSPQPGISVSKEGSTSLGSMQVYGSDVTVANPTGDSKSAQVASNLTSSDTTSDTSKTSEYGSVSKVVDIVKPLASGNAGPYSSSTSLVQSIIANVVGSLASLSGGNILGLGDPLGAASNDKVDVDGPAKRQLGGTEDADGLEESASQELDPTLQKAAESLKGGMVVPQSFERRMVKVPRAGEGNLTLALEGLPAVNDPSTLVRRATSSSNPKRDEVDSSIVDLD